MANDQDFILKNALGVGKDTKVTLGTITAGTVDLSTGNYFADTLAANTTYVFSNPGDVQSFQLEVTGGIASYNISAASYDSKSFSVSTQETLPRGVTFKTDGTKMYVVGSNTDTAYQYTLSTAWDVSTASYDSKSFSVASQETTPGDLLFSPDGTKMYVCGSATDSIYQYNLSTAWDISTASYGSVSLDVSAQELGPTGLFFKPDGTILYLIGSGSDSVHQYTLSTAYDLSTASYASLSFSVATQDTLPQGVALNSSGTKMFMVGTNTDEVHQYTLSTAYDVSTASYDSVSFSIVVQDLAPNGMAFSSDGTKLFACGTTNATIYQYSTTTDATLTWPASVEWPFEGLAPDAPAAGETDIYTFVTDDGGTSYIGLLTADAL